MTSKRNASPFDGEIKLFYLPTDVEDEDELIFVFTFYIGKNGKNKDISLTIELADEHGKCVKMKSPPEPYTLNFNKQGLCSIDGFQEEDYTLYGTIQVIKFNYEIGEFGLKLKNFDFDLYYKKGGDPQHHVTGVFKLHDPK